jgi:hypothetical protein
MSLLQLRNLQYVRRPGPDLGCSAIRWMESQRLLHSTAESCSHVIKHATIIQRWQYEERNLIVRSLKRLLRQVKAEERCVRLCIGDMDQYRGFSCG